MSEYLNRIRAPVPALGTRQKVGHTVAIFLAGIALGTFAKWLDLLGVNDAVPWQRLLGVLDWGNILSEFPFWILTGTAIAVFSENPGRGAYHVFLFFLGTVLSYHFYTVYVGGFNPQAYMITWYGVILVSPLLGYLCWYAKGNGPLSLVLKVLILTSMMFFSFYVGWIYLVPGRLANILFLLITMGVLWNNGKDMGMSMVGAFVLRVVIALGLDYL